jgi:hypothetical protein
MDKNMNTNEIIEKAKKIYGDEYDYSKTKFVDWDTKITVICKEHGEFEISPRHHIYKKCGCPKCRGKHISASKMHSKEWVINEAIKVHGDKYDYSNVDYNGIDKEIDIICKKHGVFKQLPYNHIYKKCGCPKCRYDTLSEKYRLSIEDCLSKFKEKHGDKYKYPHIEDEYVNNRSVITVVCPIHGEFKQTAMKHLQGQGCQYCNESKLEKEIASFLTTNNIEYDRQKKFDWLKLDKPMSLDFYLPKYNMAIECQGEQHYKPIEHFGGEKEYNLVLDRDNTKKKQCEENGVKLLYFTKYKNIDGSDIYKNKNKLLKEILNYGID